MLFAILFHKPILLLIYIIVFLKFVLHLTKNKRKRQWILHREECQRELHNLSIDVVSVCNYESNLVVKLSRHPSPSMATAVCRIPPLQDNHHNDDDLVYSNRPRLS